jgi:hypothetical protein
MGGLLVVFFPFVLLGFMIMMERVENPLRRAAVETRVEEFLDEADSADLDVFVREGFPAALERYTGRRGLSRLIPRQVRRGRHSTKAGLFRS